MLSKIKHTQLWMHQYVSVTSHAINMKNKNIQIAFCRNISVLLQIFTLFHTEQHPQLWPAIERY